MDKIKTEIVVLGAGPGGYAAAFYASDMGKDVILVEKDKDLGGVCLNRGCIPSKALLHVAKFVDEAKMSETTRGVSFGEPEIDLDKLRAWKDQVVAKLSKGVSMLSKGKGTRVIHGRGHFEDSNTLRVETSEGQKFIEFDKAIIAVGSLPALPKVFDLGNKRIMTSTEALELLDVPEKLLIVGGGYIGMELGTVYQALGSEITLVEALPEILAAADKDLARPVIKYAKSHFHDVRLGCEVVSMATAAKQVKVNMRYKGDSIEELYDRVLVSVGRKPNCFDLGLENTNVVLDPKGFIKVNSKQQTDDASIYAIGDCAGGLLLAHKATKEARVAVEVLAGEYSEFGDSTMPAVVFTDPEIAWAGLTEKEAKEKGIDIEVSKFPWSASGRALSFDRSDGLTKLIIEPETERLLGIGIVGANAGDLISEGVLAIEMGATVRDLAETVHPHPTLSETIMEAAELFYGHCAHAISRKKR